MKNNLNLTSTSNMGTMILIFCCKGKTQKIEIVRLKRNPKYCNVTWRLDFGALENNKAHKKTKQIHQDVVQHKVLVEWKTWRSYALYQFQGPHSSNICLSSPQLAWDSSCKFLGSLARGGYIKGCGLKFEVQLCGNFKQEGHLDWLPLTLSLSTINHCKLSP